MLAALSIRDIVLIERLDISFGPGLSVLTGETGAGKSILLDSLALGLGARGDASLVRAGAEGGEVTAVFEPGGGHPVWALLADSGIKPEDQLILRRVQSADGRTRAFINDRPVSAQLMKDAGASLVEIHGQHDDRALIDPAAHRALLDAYGGLTGAAEAVRAAWAARSAAREALDAHTARVEAARRDRDYLAHALEELDLLAPQAGEEEQLAGRRQLMMQGEKISGDLTAALETLDGEGSLTARVSAVLRKLERQAERAPELIGACIAPLERALSEAGDGIAAIEQALRATNADPAELEKTEERLFALRAAARKHSCQVEALPAMRADLRARLDEIETGESRLTALKDGLDKAAAAFLTAARALSASRQTAAATLETTVMAELEPLKLGRARFAVHIETDEDAPGASGIDRIEFWVQTNPGTQAGPLRKVASGGELARFILALKVSLADKGSAPTLVFDEIDTAVGGAVADAIGQRLARLAGRVQVISVTHAPQVAARAASHLRITKDEGAAQALVTRIAALDAPDREEEIARMLSGAEVTDEARAQAVRLLAGAR